MSKFKVGDKVKIVRCRGNGGLSLEERDLKVGEEYIIESVNPNCLNPCRDNYGLVGRSFVVYDLELELVEPKQFTKSDLKDGMVVEYRNGARELVFGSRTVDKKGYHLLKDYTETLTEHKYHLEAHDIIKVYEVNNNAISTLNEIFEDEYLTLLWEREPDYKEMTVEEIEKELGYKIKVVGDSSCQK